MRVSQVIMIYFVMGAVLFGGGAIAWQDTGATKYFVNMNHGDVTPSDKPTDKLTGVAGAITSLVGSYGGPLVLIWNLFAGLVSFVNWPLVVIMPTGAPVGIKLLIGGVPTVAFYLSVIRLVRTSA